MKRTGFLVLLVALPLGIGAFALFAGGGRERGPERSVPEESAKAPTPAPAHDVELIPIPVVRTASGDVSTTVLWPVKVELELVEPRFLPKQEGVPPVGSGATARISGRVTGCPGQASTGFTLCQGKPSLRKAELALYAGRSEKT